MFMSRIKHHQFMLIAFFIVYALTSGQSLAFGPSSDAKHDFKELMAVNWLTCNFEPVLTESGEILDGIGFDPKENRTRILTVPVEKSEIIKSLIMDEDAPFSKPMTLVFDTVKRQVQLAYPSRFFSSKAGSFSSFIIVQEVAWLTPGAFQNTLLIEVEGDEAVARTMLVVVCCLNEGCAFIVSDVSKRVLAVAIDLFSHFQSIPSHHFASAF